MNQTPLVSVVVLVYNTGDYLRPCLESIAAQTYHNLEVLMIDNGSQDGSGQVCDEYAAKDRRFRTIHQENLGIIGGRGTGVTHSRGEYLAFVDGDDLLHPEMLQLLLDECLKTDLPVSCCRFIPFFGPPPEPGPCPDDCLTFESPAHLDALMHDKRVEYSLCNKLYARHLFDNIPFYSPVVYNEDLYLNWNILQHARGMAFADFIGYYYRQHAASTTHQPLNPAPGKREGFYRRAPLAEKGDPGKPWQGAEEPASFPRHEAGRPALLLGRRILRRAVPADAHRPALTGRVLRFFA